MAWFQEGQLQNLVMSGLGILHDSPPTSLQPPLVDGVHLRWAFRPDRGFPWFGYYLFRRLQRPETRLTRDKLIPFPYLVFPGSLGTAIRETPYGWLTSDLDIALSDKFVPEAPNGGWVAGVVNFELEDRQLLRFTLKPGLLAQGAETMISFKHARQRIGFFNVGVGPNPRIEQGVSFTVKDSNSTEVYTLPPYTGLDCGQELDIDLPFPCSWVKVELATFAPPAYVTALDQDGKVVQHKQTTWPNGQAGGLTLHRDPITGNTITRVIIAGPENILYQFSYRKAVTPQEGEVQVRALLGNTPVDQATATGTDGVSVNLSLHADAISGIEFGPGPAVVSNLTLLMPYANFAEGWERLADFPYPMRLPVTHPSYPCTQNAPENLADARALARQRIRYGNPDDWVLPQTPTTTAGTVSVSSDSPGVLGTGTDWSDDLVGQVFQVAGDPTAYTILSVIASGKLVLSRPYAGLSRDGAAYAIREDPFGQLHDSLVHLVAEPAKGAMFGRALPVTFSGLGTLSVTQGSPIVTLKGATWPLELAGFGLQICGEPAGKAYATEGSSVVTGKQTSWDSGMVGMSFQYAGDRGEYTIVRVNSPTEMVLDRFYMYRSGLPPAPTRRYILAEKTIYTIASVDSATQATLDREYAGRSGTRKPFALRFDPQPAIPAESAARMGRQYPLDYVLYAALQPALAQALGLYWVDQTVEFGKSYDYLIVADLEGIFGGNPDRALQWIQAQGLKGLDCWVCLNLRAQPAAQLRAPQEVRAYALRATPVTQIDGSIVALRNIGLRWRHNVDNQGQLWGREPVFSHLWRADLGQSVPGTAPISDAYHPVTGADGRPVSIMPARPPAWRGLKRGSGFPPYALHALDCGLTEGWYSYKISSVDLFGRHTPLSAAAGWYRWVQVSDPAQWYFQHPPGETRVHPFAVQALDLTPPPMPAAVEAYALDPQDPLLLRDGAYNHWHDALTPTEQQNQNLVGLRVRWMWTEAQRKQAPRTREFRIYYHPGANPPADASDPLQWQERYYIVPYTGVRQYEILLPATGDAYRQSLPLVPSLADPIAYAHIGVSAADDRSVADNSKWWAGRWGGRPGVEGRVAAPAKIFRVRRKPPPKPELHPDSERVYATAADYHGRSYFEYRWPATQNLKAHVFRALDDSVFKADWARRPASPLQANQQELFPIEWRGYSATNHARRQNIANLLNRLNTNGHDPAGTAQAMAYYRGLPNDALRVLAGLPENASAFTQITIQPLDSGRYTDTLDGRTTNRYFYRVAYVDAAYNRGALSLSSPPVYLPNVTPPRAPVITKILGGDRQITLRWASNREPDLAEYRIYRADSQEAARDLRLMTLVHIEAVAAGDPMARPAEMEWVDAPLPGMVTYCYRVVAMDNVGNMSALSPTQTARAFRAVPPVAPFWTFGGWVSESGQTFVRLDWTMEETVEVLVQRKRAGSPLWTTAAYWLPAGSTRFDDSDVDPASGYLYRLQARDLSGCRSDFGMPLSIFPKKIGTE